MSEFTISYPLSSESIAELEKFDNDSTVDLRTGSADPAFDSAYNCSLVLPGINTLVSDPSSFDSFARFAVGMDIWYHANKQRETYPGIKNFHDTVMGIEQEVKDKIAALEEPEPPPSPLASTGGADTGALPYDGADATSGAELEREKIKDKAASRPTGTELFSLNGDYDLEEWIDDSFDLKVLKKEDEGLLLEISLFTFGDSETSELWETAGVWLVETDGRGLITDLKIELGTKTDRSRWPMIPNNYSNNYVGKGVFTIPQVYMEGNAVRNFETLLGVVELTDPETTFKGLRFGNGFDLKKEDILKRLSAILQEIMTAQTNDDGRHDASKKLSPDELALLKTVFVDNMNNLADKKNQTPKNVKKLTDKLTPPPAVQTPLIEAPEQTTPPPIDATPSASSPVHDIPSSNDASPVPPPDM